MSETTKIEWCDRTFNPWIGCTKVSPGCANCYAESEDKRRGWTPNGWGKGKPRKRTTEAYWKQALKWNREVLNIWVEKGCAKPGCGYPDGRACIGCGLAVVRPRVFPSLCDWLDEEVPMEWFIDFIDLIRATPNLDWLLLSKRPRAFMERMNDALNFADDLYDDELVLFISGWMEGTAPSNVWLGVSVENQDEAENRIRPLLEIPAVLRFLSVEPLLGPLNLRFVNLTPSLAFDALAPSTFVRQHIDWVIVGGESGPRARLCDTSWIRDIVSQCNMATVPVFVKQLGAQPTYEMDYTPSDSTVIERATRFLHLKDRKGGDPTEWPEEIRVREVPVFLA